MDKYNEIVEEVIKQSDIVIEVLDARFPYESRNKEVEKNIKNRHKKLIYVLNKSDLIDGFIDDIQLDFEPYVFVSSKKNLGTTKLRKLIISLIEKKPVQIGIVGYPNTGKSSLINVLKQRKSAKTSPKPGFTRGMQKIKIMEGIYLFDTPGVIPQRENNLMKHMLLNIKDVTTLKDPDVIAHRIITEFLHKDKKALETLYNIKIETSNPQEVLEMIALKFNWLVKGGGPNIDITSRRVIQDWQNGKLKI